MGTVKLKPLNGRLEKSTRYAGSNSKLNTLKAPFCT